VIAFWIFFVAAYLLATELNSSTSSTADVLLFLRGHRATPIQEAREYISSADAQPNSLAGGAARNNTQTRGNETIRLQKSVFTWLDVVYDIQIKDEPRRLLDHVSGWVKPGTLTALMGVSGAGKTTLLDVLAQRTSVGVVTGDMLVNGKPLDSSFQRRAGTHYRKRDNLSSEMLTMR
jgi:ATP-binding cassette subfamily G (WHITE) protein 2 (PDR)